MSRLNGKHVAVAGELVNDAPPQQPQDAHLTISAEDLHRLLDVGFAERFGGYTRMHNGADWEWFTTTEGQDKPTVFSLDELPNVASSNVGIVNHLIDLCARSNAGLEGKALVWSLQSNSDGRYMCRILLQEDKHARLITTGESNSPAIAVGLAMLQSTGVNFPDLHREIFPQRYLVTGEDL